MAADDSGTVFWCTLSSLLRFCLNMSLFCPPLLRLFLLTSLAHHKAWVWYASVVPPLSLSYTHTHTQAQTPTILDSGRESVLLSSRCNFLSTYIIHVCLWLCLCVWETTGWKGWGCLWWKSQRRQKRGGKKVEISQQRHCHKYNLAPDLTSLTADII